MATPIVLAQKFKKSVAALPEEQMYMDTPRKSLYDTCVT